MKRKTVILIGCILLLLPLTACRRRIMPDAEQTLYETFLQETAVTEQPTEAPPESTEPSTESETPPISDTTETTDASGGNGTEMPHPEPTESTQPSELTVTLDANRGACTQEHLTVSEGKPYGTLPIAERVGYTFTGWYDSKNGGNRVESTTVVTAAQDHTLYAHWSARAGYAVLFDPNGGRMASEDTERSVYAGDAYGELPVPSRRGYDFEGWYTDAEGGTAVQPTDLFVGNATQTLYAHWRYNPSDYWSFFLENTTQQVYSCQQKSVYPEFDADGVTAGYCSLISAIGSYSVAQNREDPNVTDEWVLEKNPDAIVKIVGDFGNAAAFYNAMSARFPGYRVFVVPSAAIYGSDAQQLYYRIYLGKLLYPEWYTQADMDSIAEELGVSGSIYGA